MGDFLNELKRRNVFRVGVAYGVVGWIVVQITGVAVPALYLPEWVTTLVFFLGLIGFPFALLFAWAFELTPEGLKRSKDVATEESVAVQTGKRLEHGIIAGLVIAVLFLIFKPDDLWREQAGTDASGAVPSIAVLPFEDFSPERDQEYFSSGISEEILNLLAKTNNLRVAARTSSFAFRDGDHDIRDIGRKLDVATVLEGSIRKSGQTLRITAQLINVEDGYHIWSETYDRELNDVFAIQDEIAASILQSLKIHLLGEQAQQAAIRSADLDAYNAYLIGRQRLAQQTRADIEAARDRFEDAIELDPAFAPARAQLALAMLQLEGFGSQNPLSGEDEVMGGLKPDTDAAVQQQLAEAARLAPDLPEVSAVRGFYHLRRFRYEEARRFLDRAIALNPNYAQAYLWRADVHYHDNDFRAMLADRETAYRLDPMSLEISRELAYDYRSFWRPQDAARIIQRMFELRPGHPDAYWAKATNFSAQGQYAEATLVLEEGLKSAPDQQRFKFLLTLGLIYMGEFEAARSVGSDWVEFEIARLEGRLGDAQKVVEEKLAGDSSEDWLWRATSLYRQAGDRDKLRQVLSERIAGYERQGVPWKERCDMWLIEALHFADMPDGTDSMMAECREKTEGRLEAGYLCPCSWFDLVAFAALDGRTDDAVKRAYEWLDKGDSWYDLEMDPIFDLLKDRPEYDDLLRRNREQVARQRRLYLEAKAAADKGASSGTSP